MAPSAKPHRTRVEDLTAELDDLNFEEDDNKHPVFVVLEDDDEDNDTDFCRVLSATEVAAFISQRERSALVTPPTSQQAPFCNSSGVILIPGVCGELFDGDFILIKKLLHDDGLKVQGILLRRTRRLDDQLPKKCNEVCAILQTTHGCHDPHIDECLVTVSADAIFQTREVVFTNRSFPEFSFRENGKMDHTYRKGGKTYYNWLKVEEHEVLVCRRKYVEVLDIKSGKMMEGAFMWLSETECDSEKSTLNILRKKAWRNVVAKEMDSPPKKENKMRSELMDVDDDDDSEYVIVKKSTNSGTQKSKKCGYKHADLCTGAGGAALGAFLAGLPSVFFLDHWNEACTTLHINFSPVIVLHNSIFEFCTEKLLRTATYIVDVLHISFPCQTHSSAHTVPGKNDEANLAAGYSVIPILKLCKPRVVTFEQTSGIITHNGAWHFRALIHQITAMEYSVRWKIVNCAEYGAAQARKRLILIASCPGEPLPPFPEPTHGDAPGLKPFTTINSALAQLGVEIDPNMNKFTPKCGIPYDGNQPLRNCITTNGGESDLHPNGRRSFKLCELAVLAGFTPDHRFFGGTTSVRKQIGNAVPACFAKTLFEEIVKSLQEADRMEAAWQPEVIMLDDDEDDEMQLA